MLAPNMVDPPNRPSIGPAWYVASTYLHRENRAHLEVGRAGFDRYLPMETYSAKGKNRKTIERKRPLFPQYLFVRFDIETDPWGYIAEQDAVRTLLDVDGKPAPIPDEFIDRIKSAEDIGLFDKTVDHLRMTPGDPVEVLEGPFSHHVGKFAGASSRQRVRLLMDVLGRETVVSFDVGDVRRVK